MLDKSNIKSFSQQRFATFRCVTRPAVRLDQPVNRPLAHLALDIDERNIRHLYQSVESSPSDQSAESSAGLVGASPAEPHECSTRAIHGAITVISRLDCS